MNTTARTLASTLALALGTAFAAPAFAAPKAPAAAVAPAAVSDAALVKTLPGFQEGVADVNGVRLHYVAGGSGSPVVLLPGWPETWWAFHKIMPALARHHRVISVDLRGMGASGMPAGGYDKKTMAADIAALVRHLGYDKATVIGHDIGSQVAYAYAANFPLATDKLVLIDVPHPDQSLYSWPILPQAGTFGDKIDDAHPFAWWFAFHQVKGLPEQLLEGRQYLEQEWFFRYLLKDEGAIDARDRAVYRKAYASREAIRAGNAWYQAFPQDILDDKGYAKLTMPVLAIGGPGYGWLQAVLTPKTTNLKLVKAEGSGHFVAEEKPAETTAWIEDFLN
ncbi:alpha/beta fold hydrolase [Massilia sp. TN1-12]|uniref:alpha/beta fold hydrolase n=1 Tax=Massilia paldalensis TaxID=3377675 RepID=UPI00384D0D3C